MCTVRNPVMGPRGDRAEERCEFCMEIVRISIAYLEKHEDCLILQQVCAYLSSSEVRRTICRFTICFLFEQKLIIHFFFGENKKRPLFLCSFLHFLYNTLLHSDENISPQYYTSLPYTHIATTLLFRGYLRRLIINEHPLFWEHNENSLIFHLRGKDLHVIHSRCQKTRRFKTYMHISLYIATTWCTISPKTIPECTATFQRAIVSNIVYQWGIYSPMQTKMIIGACTLFYL